MTRLIIFRTRLHQFIGLAAVYTQNFLTGNVWSLNIYAKRRERSELFRTCLDDKPEPHKFWRSTNKLLDVFRTAFDRFAYMFQYPGFYVRGELLKSSKSDSRCNAHR